MGWNVCCLVLLVTGVSVARTWDVIVSNSMGLDKLMANGDKARLEASPALVSPATLALSPRHDVLFIGDNGHPNASLLELELRSHRLRPLLPRQNMEMFGLALDPLGNALYWTTGYGKSIMRLHLDGSRTPEMVLKFKEELPQGIAVETCERFLFWTNSNNRAPSIERSNLDGSDRRRIVTSDLFMPLGIAVDQAERKLYWSQEREGVYYSIERSNFDGRERETIVHSVHHQPYALAVGSDLIFWSDWTTSAVWSIPKDRRSKGPATVSKLDGDPMGLVAFVEGQAKTNSECRAIVAAYNERMAATTTAIPTTVTDEVTEADWKDAEATDDFCVNNGAVMHTPEHGPICRCLPGYSGKRCEIELCFNYCVRGTCKMDSRGGASCECDQGFSGPRCEVDVCSGFCLNEGRCKLNAGAPQCTCPSPFKGDRCEVGPSQQKLCQLYCDNLMGFVPLENQPLCKCPANGSKHKYDIDGLNASALIHQASDSNKIATDDGVSKNTLLTVTIVLIVLVILLMIGIILLVQRVHILRKRPRVKKRFIGSKSVTPTPLTNRPSPGADDCEINIENCCNMNICETPCFEPNVRTLRPGSKREEKKTLLASMDNSQAEF